MQGPLTCNTFKKVVTTPALTPDHILKMEDDTDKQHREYAYTIGYIQEILNAANREMGE